MHVLSPSYLKRVSSVFQNWISWFTVCVYYSNHILLIWEEVGHLLLYFKTSFFPPLKTYRQKNICSFIIFIFKNILKISLLRVSSFFQHVLIIFIHPPTLSRSTLSPIFPALCPFILWTFQDQFALLKISLDMWASTVTGWLTKR